MENFIFCAVISPNISTGHRIMSGKKRIMSNEGFFATNTVARREVKKNINYRRLKTQKY